MTPEEIEEMKASIQSLERKNAELLAEKNRANDMAKSAAVLQEKLNGTDVDALLEAQAKLKDLEDEDAAKRGAYEELLAKHRDESAKREEKLQAERDSERAARYEAHKALELRQALTDAKIKPEFIDAVLAMHGPTVAIDTDAEGKLVAKVGDVSLAEHVTEWAKTASGKVFVGAANGSGMGAYPPGAPGLPAPDAAKFFDRKSGKWNFTEQSRLEQQDPEMYKSLTAQYPDHAEAPAQDRSFVGGNDFGGLQRVG